MYYNYVIIDNYVCNSASYDWLIGCYSSDVHCTIYVSLMLLVKYLAVVQLSSIASITKRIILSS